MVLHKSPFLYIPEIYGIQAYIRLKNDRKVLIKWKNKLFKECFSVYREKSICCFFTWGHAGSLIEAISIALHR